MSRRKRKGPAARCEVCGLQVKFFRSWTGALRPFAPIAIDPTTTATAVPNAHPVFGGRAWLLDELVDELMARTAQGRGEATDEAYALPWHVAHTCPPAIDEAES